MNKEKWATEFFRAVDSSQPDKIAQFVTDDVRLQMANREVGRGVDEFKSAFEGAANRFVSIVHKIEGVWSGVWEQGEVVSVEALVQYELPNKKVIELPCTTTLRLRGDKIADYRIFIEPSPAFREEDESLEDAL